MHYVTMRCPRTGETQSFIVCDDHLRKLKTRLEVAPADGDCTCEFCRPPAQAALDIYRRALHSLDEAATKLANILGAEPEHGGDSERADQVAQMALAVRAELSRLPRIRTFLSPKE